MDTPLEEILARLLEPDNDVIQKATADLKEAFKNPGTLQTLWHILGTSPQPQVRQYAAILIRKKIKKAKQWAALDEAFKTNIRGSILQLFLQEQQKSTRSSIVQIIASMAKHDIPTQDFPALFEFILNSLKDQDPARREAGMFVLSNVAILVADEMQPHLTHLLNLFTEALKETVNPEVSYLAIKSMTDVMVYIRNLDEEMECVTNVVPRVLEVVQALTTVDEEKACVALEFFDELLESKIAMINPHLNPLVEYCLQTANKKDYTDAMRVKAMSTLANLIRFRRKAIMKNNLIDTILQSLIPIICEDDGEDDDEDEEVEANKPSQNAVQVVDTMALHLHPGKFLNKLMPIVEVCLKSTEPNHRRAAYLVMAVIVEGCGDYVMKKMLSQMLQTVCAGLNDSSHIVQNAALYAVGQFSEYLQPDISQYASELLPLLFMYLNKSMEDAEKNPKGLVKSHYALEMFCENLGDGILPYLHDLMTYLLNVLQNCPLEKAKELAISAIGGAANAAKEKMQPYFKDVLIQFKAHLSGPAEEEQMKKTQLAAIDTMAVFARTIGKETFGPLAKECLDMGLNMLDSSDDPDLRRCVYGLFSAVSTLVKTDMANYLEKIITFILTSMKSTDGMKAYYNSESDAMTLFDGDDFDKDANDDKEDAEVDDYKLQGITVENVYLDEKEDACSALGEIAISCGHVFLPYMEQSYTETLDLVTYPAVGIKKAALGTLGQLCLCVHEAHKQTQSAEAAEALKTMIIGAVPIYLDAIKTEKDRTVVMKAVDNIQELLAKVGEPVLAITGSTDSILAVMKEIFTHKVPCQGGEVDEAEDDIDAEFDSMLMESAGDVLPVIARIIGGANFVGFFSHFVQDLLKRLKETSSTSEKAFAVGTMAEVIEACGEPVGSAFAGTLYPVFTQMASDEDEEVRSNSVFGLGVLSVTGGPAMLGRYNDVLKTLFSVMNKDSEPSVLDNICGAVCRMIWHSPQTVPLAEVFPVVMQLLPLKEDVDENGTVFTCVIKLYSETIPELTQFIPKLLNVAVVVAKAETVKDETQRLVIQFVKLVKERYPTEYDQVRSSMEPDAGAVLDTCLSARMPWS